MYNKQDSELNDIIEGFQMMGSDNGGLVNPNEFKEIMDIMNMSEKNPFIYNIILSLCSDEETQNKGGIEASEFIALLDQELNDTSSTEGLEKIFTVFSNPSTNTIPLSTFSQIASGERDQNETTIKKLISKPEINGKEINFEEFHDIVKTETPRQSMHDNIIYKKKQSSNNKNYSDENINNKALENNGNNTKINYNNKKINNNNNYNSYYNNTNQRDSIESGDKNNEVNNNNNDKNMKYSYKKPRPEKSMYTDNNNNINIQGEINNNLDIDKDVNTFDNPKKYNNNVNEEEEVVSTKKKYRHKRRSNNQDSENEKPKEQNEQLDGDNNAVDNNNENNGKRIHKKFIYETNKKEITEINYSDYKEEQKEKQFSYRYSENHTKGRMDQKNNIDTNENIDNEEKSDTKAERRYHRRYRDVKSSTPDKMEEKNNKEKDNNNNNGNGNNNKNSLGYRYRRKK